MNIIAARYSMILISIITALLGVVAAIPADNSSTPEFEAADILAPALIPELVADIAITKTGAPDPVVAGETLIYTLTASNVDAADATTVLITDTLPLSVTFASASPDCTYLSGTHEVSCSLAVLAMTSTTVLTMNVVVDPAATADLVNHAVINHDDTDPDPGNNATGPVTTTVVTSANLGLSKATDTDPVTAGEALSYTLTITNTGPSAAVGLLITDTLPLSVTFSSASPECTYLPGAHEVSCSVAALPVASSAALTMTVVVDPAASTDLINQAVVSHDSEDPDPGDNATGPVTTTVVTSGDLALSKTASSDLVAAGEPLTYTLTITNTGPSVAAGALLTDTLPASGITFASATPGSCAHSSGTVTCDLGSLQPDQVMGVEIVVDVDTNATGNLLNSADIAALTSDPNVGNNTASVSTEIEALADLSIMITDVPDPVTAGVSILTYTLTVENLGPSMARNVSAVDDLPPDVTFGRIVSPALGCSHNSGTVLCSLGDLDAGANRVIEIETSVDHDAAGTIVNFANVTSLTSDPASSNNSAGETTQVRAISDLTIHGDVFPDPVAAGTILTYTLSITNTGPSTAAQTIMTATLPGDVSFDSAMPLQGTCGETGGIVTCSLGDLDPGQATGVVVVSTVDPGYGGLLSATIETSSDSTDPAPGDNVVMLDTTAQVQADLQVEKFDMPGALPPGANLTYTILLENLGPSDATGVVITDTLPAEVNFISVTPPAGGSCNGTTIVNCDLVSLAAGQVATATIQVEVDAATPLGLITNWVAVDSAISDLNPVNNVAVQDTTVSNEVIDLALGMVESVDPLLPGEVLTYTLSVTNTGPSVATGVVLTNTLPGDVTLISAGASQGNCASPGLVVCNLGSLTAGASATVVIEATVNSDAADLLVNNAEVSGVEVDSNTGNNSAFVETTVFVITWVSPVSEGERYDTGVETVLLEVDVTDRLAIDRVEFRRWDTVTLNWVMIGTVTTIPYEINLDSTTLNFEWNEIRARAFDEEGNVSLEPRIWIYRLYNKYLPLMANE